jgi:hypothetical protein
VSVASHTHFNGPPIAGLQGSAFRIPTATPESDGTTLVLVEARAGRQIGALIIFAAGASPQRRLPRFAEPTRKSLWKRGNMMLGTVAGINPVKGTSKNMGIH